MLLRRNPHLVGRRRIDAHLGAVAKDRVVDVPGSKLLRRILRIDRREAITAAAFDERQHRQLLPAHPDERGLARHRGVGFGADLDADLAPARRAVCRTDVRFRPVVVGLRVQRPAQLAGDRQVGGHDEPRRVQAVYDDGLVLHVAGSRRHRRHNRQNQRDQRQRHGAEHGILLCKVRSLIA